MLIMALVGLKYVVLLRKIQSLHAIPSHLLLGKLAEVCAIGKYLKNSRIAIRLFIVSSTKIARDVIWA